MIIEVILYLVILATSIPAGLLLARLCEDELIKDRRYFILAACLIGIVLFAIILAYPRVSFILSLVYMLSILAVMLYKSKKIS